MVRQRRIPWRPEFEPDSYFLRWRALVQERRVEATLAGLIDDLEDILIRNPTDPMPAFRRYALSRNLDASACTQ